MTKKKKRIGMLSYWGIGRGLAYVTLGYVKMLQDDYDIFIFKQGDNKINKEFKNVNVKITEYPHYIVPREKFVA